MQGRRDERGSEQGSAVVSVLQGGAHVDQIDNVVKRVTELCEAVVKLQHRAAKQFEEYRRTWKNYPDPSEENIGITPGMVQLMVQRCNLLTVVPGVSWAKLKQNPKRYVVERFTTADLLARIRRNDRVPGTPANNWKRCPVEVLLRVADREDDLVAMVRKKEGPAASALLHLTALVQMNAAAGQ